MDKPSSSSVFTRTTRSKRDAGAAELDRESPTNSTSKRHAFESTIARASLERKIATLQTAKVECESKLREKELLVERLERDRRWFSEREEEEKKERERERIQYEQDKKRTDTELRSLRTALNTLREEHADLKDEHSNLSRTTSHTIATQKTQITTLSRQTQMLGDELKEARMLADDRLSAMHELETRLEEAPLQTNEVSVSEKENMAVVREELHRQAKYLRTLEGTNTRLSAELAALRDRHTSVEVLKEEKRGLEKKLRGMEELREKVVKLEAEVEAGRKEREDWADLSQSHSPSKSPAPISVTQALSDLRLTHASLLEKHGATVAVLRTREAELKDVEERLEEAAETNKKLTTHIRALTDKVTRGESEKTLLEREIGFLKALVASFDAEHEAEGISPGSAERVAELENLVQAYKDANALLRSEVGDDTAEVLEGRGKSRKELREEVDKERAQAKEVSEALAAAESAVEAHLATIDSLEQQLFELSGEIAGGRHVPPNTRVLMLRDNPEQEWVDIREATVQALKKENAALLEQVKGLQGQFGSSVNNGDGGMVPRASWELINKEKEDLEDLLRKSEKRRMRLQQIFQSKSAEFREAVSSILGVKLAFHQNGQVRVTSMFDLNACFVFQPEEGSDMKMTLVGSGEDGPDYIPDLMQIWIGNEQCIPGMIASVTLESWERVKMEQRNKR